MSRCLATVLIIMLAPSTASAQKDPVPNLPIESYTLPNGLKVVLHRDASVPRVTVCLAYHVGSKNEVAGRTGFAHFFEHMMFRGTKNVPNYDVPLQETGAQSNAFTSEDLTVYYETVPAPFLERALYLEAERLAFLPSALDQAKFDTEREVVKNERLQSYENVPYGMAEEALLAAVFPEGHPYSWSVIGSMKDLNAATVADLRRFFAEFYHPANAALCLAGDFDPAQARATIARYFGPIPPGPAPRPVAPPPAPLAKPALLAERDKVTLPRLYRAWPTVADDHADAPALHLLAACLTDGQSSRLHRALVQDARVATDVDADSDTKEVAGLFTLDATAAEGKTLDQVARALDAAFADLAKNPPTAAELARALAQFERATFKSLTSPLGRAITLSTNFVEKGDPAAYRADYARYHRVTTADLARVAARYLTANRVNLTIEKAGPDAAKSAAPVVGPKPGPVAELPARPPINAPGVDWATLPGPTPAPPWQTPRYVRKTLSNGMEVWISPWRTLPLVEARLIFPVGTADDPTGKSGLASLTASIIDKGTTARTASEFAEELETLGASLGVGASHDATSLSLSVLARNLAPAFDLVGRLLETPRFDPKDFTQEQQLQVDGLLQGPDSPTWIAGRAFRTLMYGPAHPYGNHPQGSPATVKGLTLADVRAAHARLAANRAKLIVVGDVDPDALAATFESTLGRWKTTGPAPGPRPKVEAPAAPAVVHLVDKPGAVQSVIAVGRRWVDRKDPRHFAASIGNRVVGEDFLSRLNANLREKNGYSYGCGSSFVYRRTGGAWQATSEVRADVTAEALKEVIGELDALAQARPLTDAEIATARDAEVRSFPESFDNPGGIAGVLVGIAQFDLAADYLDTYLGSLRATPDDQVRGVTVEVVNPADRVILVVGDRATVEPRLKALGFREIRLVDPDGKASGR